MDLYTGKPVLYRCREPRAGQQDLAAMVTRAYPDGTADLIIFPPMSEFYHQPRVMPMSDALTRHCWHEPEDEPERRPVGRPRKVA